MVAEMAHKKKITAVVDRQREIATDIFELWLRTDLAEEAKAGQFIAVYPKDKSTLLPRPISICEVGQERRQLRIVYRIAGKGTREFSQAQAGDSMELLGVLGNGFPLEKASGKRVFLMGGGIGIPPLLQAAKELADMRPRQGGLKEAYGLPGPDGIQTILGYRNRELFLQEELQQYGPVFLATEDGSAGTKGNVMDAIEQNALSADIIFACGPMPMLRAIKRYAEQNGAEAYISLEERMACGVGACLGCVCKTRETDAHSQVHNARICTDGPVFDAREVDI